MTTISSYPTKLKTFEVNKNELPKNFQLTFKKSKNTDTLFSTYSPIHTGGSFLHKNQVQPKVRDKKYFQDVQINLMSLNIIKNYHKVFKNEEGSKYTKEYIKNVCNLLHKNEEDYSSKRMELDPNKTHAIKRGKTSFYMYQSKFTKRNSEEEKEKVLEKNKKSKIKKPNTIRLKCNVEEKGKYSLNNSYDSNESVELTVKQSQKIKKNLIEKYNFFHYFDRNKDTGNTFMTSKCIYKETSSEKKLPLIQHNLFSTLTNSKYLKDSQTAKSSQIFLSDYNNKINYKQAELNKSDEHIRHIKQIINNICDKRDLRIQSDNSAANTTY